MKSRLIFILLALGLAPPLWAAGTCTVTNITSTQNASSRIPDSNTVIVTVNCTGDASTGSFPSVTVPLYGYYPQAALNQYNLTGYILYQVGRTPGTTNPTANYTVTVKDADGFALDQGVLTSNGSASAAQLTAITTSTTLYPVVRSSLTVAITGNSVNSAGITLDLIFRVGGTGSASSSPGGSVTITGGTIDGTVIGGTTPAAGTFTTVSGAGTGLTGTAASLSIGGTAAGLSGTPALPNGTTATTGAVASNNTNVATQAYADKRALSVQGGTSDTVTCATAFAGTNNLAPFSTTYTIAANQIKAGTLLRLSMGVSATSSGGPNMAVRMTIGSSAVMQTNGRALQAGTASLLGQSLLIQGTAAASASSAVLVNPTSACMASAVCGLFDWYANGSPSYNMATNGTLTITPELYCSAGTAGNSVTLNQLVVELVTP